MKYGWKGHKDRNRHKNRVKKGVGKLGWFMFKTISAWPPPRWRWARGDSGPFWILNILSFIISLKSTWEIWWPMKMFLFEISTIITNSAWNIYLTHITRDTTQESWIAHGNSVPGKRVTTRYRIFTEGTSSNSLSFEAWSRSGHTALHAWATLRNCSFCPHGSFNCISPIFFQFEDDE